MPENLINRLNQQNDLAVLQQNIVQDKSLSNISGFFNIIYLPDVFYADYFEQYDLTYMPVQNKTKGPVKIDTVIHATPNITQNNFYLYSGELQRLFKL